MLTEQPELCALLYSEYFLRPMNFLFLQQNPVLNWAITWQQRNRGTLSQAVTIIFIFIALHYRHTHLYFSPFLSLIANVKIFLKDHYNSRLSWMPKLSSMGWLDIILGTFTLKCFPLTCYYRNFFLVQTRQLVCFLCFSSQRSAFLYEFSGAAIIDHINKVP